MPKPPLRRPQALNIPKAIQQAVGFHQQGRLMDAAKLYQAILESHPTSFDALHLSGVVSAQLGQLEKSAALISRALAFKPESAEAHFNLGLTLSLPTTKPSKSIRRSLPCFSCAAACS